MATPLNIDKDALNPGYIPTPGNFQTTSQKNANGEIINPTPTDVKNFNSQFTTIKPANTNTVLSADSLVNAPKINLGQPQIQDTSAVGLGASLEQIGQNYTDTITKEAEVKKAEADKASSSKAVTDYLKGTQGEVGLTDQAYKETGVDTAKKELNDINNQMVSEQVSLRRQVEQIEKNMVGASAGAIQSEVNRITRQSVAKQADLAVIQMAKQNNYFGAKEIADRAVAMKMEEDNRNLEILEMQHEELKDLFTTKEERLYQEMLANKKAETDKKKTDLQTISDMALDALQNGAPTSIVSQMQKATSVEEATRLGGQYVGALDRQLKQAQLNKAQNDAKTSQFTATLTDAQKADPFIQKMVASAGGKPLTDTFAQQLNKGLTVLDQIGTLQTNIKDVNTGPIVGLFKGANPWDTNAQTIKAQLNAIVPNLARGVYGEVGVLTDADIANYSKTLPNLKSTDDIRNAVLGITVDLIGKSLKRNLEINAANGKDVSGFVDTYTQMLNTRDSIFSQIPGYKGASNGSVSNLSNEDLLGNINNTINSWGNMNNTDFFNQI
jgi:hypothetical protein